MIAFPTDKGGAAIRPYDDALDRDLSYRMQQISKNVSSHHLLHGMFGILLANSRWACYNGVQEDIPHYLEGRNSL